MFSIANASAFVLRAAAAEIRPKSDQPTVGRVTYVSEKELLVGSSRGSLAITVDGVTEYIAEGMSYRVFLDLQAYYAAYPEAAREAKQVSREKRELPKSQLRDPFVLVRIGAITGVMIWLLYEAFESPDRP